MGEMVLRLLLAVLGSVLSILATSEAAPAPTRPLSEIELKTVFVTADERDSNFTVVDARFDETATAAVLFGLAGAAINSATNASEDDKKADTLREVAKSVDIAGILSDSLARALERHGELELRTDRGAAGHTIEVAIHNWGLTRANREDARMRTFLNLSVSVIDAKGRVVWEKKRENSVGQSLAPFEEFTAERFKSEMESLAAKSGQYIGNQINYR